MSSADIQNSLLNYLAFTYFILLWSEMTEMTRFPRHCSVTVIEVIKKRGHSNIPQSIIDKAVDQRTARLQGERASLWTSVVNNRFFSEPPTVNRRKRVALYVFSVW